MSLSDAGGAVSEAVGDGLILIENGEPRFTIVRPKTTTQTVVGAVIALNSAVKAATGKELGIITDSAADTAGANENACEILVGDTNRAESAALKATLAENTFAIKATDTKIIIVASTDFLLERAISHFAESFLTAPAAETGEGYLLLKNDINYVSDSNHSYLKDCLTTAQSFASYCKFLYYVPVQGDATVLQGGCMTDEYNYTAFIKRDYVNNELNNQDIIVKTEAITGKVIGKSNPLALNHCNDITYNSKENLLVVVHNNPNRTTVTLVNPDTLEIVRSETLPCKIYCIAYNEARDIYVVGLSGGQSFRFLTSDFQLLDSTVHQPTPLTVGYTTQGVACDDNLIFFVLYNRNVITVYDWNGSFVTLIKLNVSGEPENISIVKDTLYVSCASGGGKVYRVTPKAE